MPAPPPPPLPLRHYLYDSIDGTVPGVCEAAGAEYARPCEEACFAGQTVQSCIDEREQLQTLVQDPADRQAADALFSDCLIARSTTRELLARCVASCVEVRGGKLCRSVLPAGPSNGLASMIAADPAAPAREWFLHAQGSLGYLFGNHDPATAFIPAAARLQAGLEVRRWDLRVGVLAQGVSRFALGLGLGWSMPSQPLGQFTWTPVTASLEAYPSSVAFLVDVASTLRIPDRRFSPYGGRMAWRVSLGLTGYLAGYPNEQFIAPTVSFGAELGQ